MNELPKPNAFIFKAFIDGEYRYCICPRIDNKWSEQDIFYIRPNETDLPFLKDFDDILDNEKFSIVFIGYELDPSGEGFNVKNVDSKYLKSDTALAKDMYQKNSFFETIEEGYNLFYEQQSSGQGEQTQTNQ